LDASPVNEVLIEEGLLGWKEFEMEVMRDKNDHCVVICAIENLDPMGIHTGDSITVAPSMTLSDKEYQRMRDASFAVIRAIGVETGGSNVQFAINPENGHMIVIEMNPRVSRSSALASKATGIPIAKLAAKLAVGYTLDELKNDITGETFASYEPSIDYVVTKIPRFTFEKFPGADTTLTSSMKSVGEAMAIGRTFKESFQKAVRSLEIGSLGFGGGGKYGQWEVKDSHELMANVAKPTAERIFFVRFAFIAGMSVAKVHELSKIDPWFLHQLKEIVDLERSLIGKTKDFLTPELLMKIKQYGFSDKQIGNILRCKGREIRKLRNKFEVNTVYRLVDTCAAEFEAKTPYYYSTYGLENEIIPSDKRKIMILGGGPNRIGQGIEFDYCCVHASFALREQGFETVMVNSNPETVSTDYDTSSRLYFEPLTLGDVLEIYYQEQCEGAIIQLGGQTPLNLALELKEHGVNILGTTPESIERAEDRELFKQILSKLGLKQPKNRTALTPEKAYEVAGEIGFPILLRPSFVLGGRGMFIIYDMEGLKKAVREAFDAAPGKPVLLDQFLEDAIELDVDCVSDGETTVIGGMLEHVEHAGVHSGDACMVMPPHTVGREMIERIRKATYALARELEVIGLMNTQFVIKDDDLYVLEVNPRASRTIPFVAKAIGVPLAKYAARVMAGEKLKDIGFTREVDPEYWCIKTSVFPFNRFPGSPVMLSPEMRSTGEVMGRDTDIGLAFAKSLSGAQPGLPTRGNVFISVKNTDKPKAIDLAQRLQALGFNIYATAGTVDYLEQNGITVRNLFRISDGARPNVLDLIKNGDMQMIINTPEGVIPQQDDCKIREEAILHSVCMIPTMSGAYAALKGIIALQDEELTISPIQELGCIRALIS